MEQSSHNQLGKGWEATGSAWQMGSPRGWGNGVEVAWTQGERHGWGTERPHAVTRHLALPSPGGPPSTPAPQRGAGGTMARLFSPRPPPSEDLFYETYYSLSQQYPLVLLLLVIVLCALLAMLAVASASGRVSRGASGGAGLLPEGGGRVTA